MAKDDFRYNDGMKRRVTSTYFSEATFAGIKEYQKKLGIKSKSRAISKLVDNHLYLVNQGIAKEQIRLKRSGGKFNGKS